MKHQLYLLLFLAILSCNEAVEEEVVETSSTNTTAETPSLSPADDLLATTLLAHGGNRYETASFSFVFRGRTYEFQNDGASFRYQRSYQKDGQDYLDILNNDGPSRLVNGLDVDLTEKEAASLSEGLNSVIYFATLPHKLQDPAVIKKHGGTTTIKGKTYDILEVAFQEEGGGTDHDDNFRYWINQEDHTIDYLAYDYKVDEGGVRFRSAYDRRVVDGIIFQDYVNYKAPLGTTLDSLPKMYESGDLVELSRIATESVKALLH